MGDRRLKDLTITAEGRDKGKTFLLTEMNAMDGEEWAMRALLALARGGVDIPDDLLKAGMRGFAALGPTPDPKDAEDVNRLGAWLMLNGFSKMDFDEARPLLAEMMACVKIREPLAPDGVRTLTRNDVEEVKTLFEIRGAVLRLHTAFFTNSAT